MKRSELRNLIQALGGPTVVGKRFGISHSAVSHWTSVPVAYCPTVEVMCQEKGLTRSDGTPYTREVFQPSVEWQRDATVKA